MGARRPRKPLKEPTSASESRLLEKLAAEFRTFGEGLEDIRGRLAAVEAEVRDFRDFTTFQRLASENMRDNLNSLTAMSRKITADIAAMRDDLTSAEAKLAS